jgi:hypothetical protein
MGQGEKKTMAKSKQTPEGEAPALHAESNSDAGKGQGASGGQSEEVKKLALQIALQKARHSRERDGAAAARRGLIYRRAIDFIYWAALIWTAVLAVIVTIKSL